MKSVYQRYLGWYDANPANLNPLPPVERGRKYVEYMGGAAAVIERAREDFARGEYRFVAEAMSHVVFADPSNTEARSLGADALEQLGYARSRRPGATRTSSGPRSFGEAPTAAGGRALPQPLHRPSDEPRPRLRLPGRAAQRREGRGEDHRDQLGLLRTWAGAT